MAVWCIIIRVLLRVFGDRLSNLWPSWYSFHTTDFISLEWYLYMHKLLGCSYTGQIPLFSVRILIIIIVITTNLQFHYQKDLQIQLKLLNSHLLRLCLCATGISVSCPNVALNPLMSSGHQLDLICMHEMFITTTIEKSCQLGRKTHTWH